MRCKICGEKLIPFYDHSKGRDVYEKHDHSGKEEETEIEVEQPEPIGRKTCPSCEGSGYADPHEIHRCARCGGKGDVPVFEEEIE